jgi:hypothetical protein
MACQPDDQRSEVSLSQESLTVMRPVSIATAVRYWIASSQDLAAKVHTIIRTAIGQYYVHKAVVRGCARANIQPGSVTFIQRFGSAINVNKLVVDCVYLSEPLSSLL